MYFTASSFGIWKSPFFMFVRLLCKMSYFWWTSTRANYPVDFFNCDRKHLDMKFSTKHFSTSEKYGWKHFEHYYIKSIVLINIRKKNDFLENTHHLRYSILFSNVIFPETPRMVWFCGLGGVGKKVVDVLGKPTKACFVCLLILSYSSKWLLADLTSKANCRRNCHYVIHLI